MNAARFEFHADLNDFLPRGQRFRPLEVRFRESPSVKHLIEACGVPHPEVALIRINGAVVDFSAPVHDGDRVEVLPISALPAGAASPLENQPEGEVRFILDLHLGRLAVYLRILGFDSLYRNDYEDEELARTAGEQGRVLLTRDQRLLMRSQVRYGYWVRALDPQEQIVEVISRYRLAGQVKPFHRCLRCNTRLQPVEKQAVLERLEPLTRRYYHEFRRCPQCDQIFWKGSHYERMQALVDRVLALDGKRPSA